ncbi:odorant receptor 43a-like [Harpegnathos saltator]|uniref:odorant receptor 43a-like n=1 Tax=Harpegnathos saltator TaxID=610380 RepID=UPI000DBEE22E|nr:odorant receptor 43a-like [Harpegnathos saltator]
MEHSSRHNDFEWAISLNQLMLKIIGLWPPDNHIIRKKMKSKIRLFYSITTILFILIIPALISLMRVWGDMILMIENMQYSLPLLATISKLIIIWYKQADLLSVIHMIEEDWTKPKMKEERDVMLKRAINTRTIAMWGLFVAIFTIVITFGFSYFGLILRHVTNLTDSGKPMLIPSYYFHDVSKSPQFELTFLAQGITLIASGCSYTAVDHLLGLLVLHVCGQLENLHFRLAYMRKYPNFLANLKYNVLDHIRLIRSIEIIDNTFDSLLLVVMLYFGIIFCLKGFLIVEVVNRGGKLSLMQLLWFAAAIIYILLHMCLYSAVGEILVTQSEKIHQATYKYPWYNVEPKAAKSLMLIMLRASKPLHITAGKIFPMTMATFGNLLKTSAGYISVLLAKQNS